MASAGSFPVHGGTGSSAGSGAGSAASSPGGAAGGGGVGAGGSWSGSPGSAGGADGAGTAGTSAAPKTDASYYGIDPIHGDTSASSWAHGAARTDADAAAGSPRADGSGPEGAHTSAPDAGTVRAEGGGPDAAPTRTNDTDSGSGPAEAGGAGSASGTHAGGGAGPQSSRSAPHETSDAPDAADAEPARADVDRADSSARDGSRPEADQDAGGRGGRVDADEQTGNGTGSRDGSGRPSESGQDTSRNGSDADAEPHGRSDTGTDTRGRSDADSDPDARDRSGHDPEQPDQHRKDVPDERPRGQEPESAPARRDSAGNNSHSNPTAADGTAPHGKADDAPDPTSNHKDTHDTDTTSNRSNNDGDTEPHHAHDDKTEGGDDRSHDDGHRHSQDGDGPDHERDQHDNDADNSHDGDIDTTDNGDGLDIHDSRDIPALFEHRQELIDHRNALEQRLDEQMPEGYTSKDFNVNNRDKSLEQLERAGYNPRQLRGLERTAEDLTNTRREIRDTSARIGEVGGEKYLAEQGTPVLDEWAIDNNKDLNNGTVLGGYTDGASRSAPDKDGHSSDFYIEEYKGADARTSSRDVQTHHEDMARQGSDAYARDHLLTDPRFAQYFHDHPRLWEDIKNGDTQLHYRVISTRTPDGPPHVTDKIFKLVDPENNVGPEVRDHLQRMIDEIGAQGQQPPAPEAG